MTAANCIHAVWRDPPNDFGDDWPSIIDFSMERARDHAWSVAERLAPLDEAGQTLEIERLDRDTLMLARLVREPGVVGGLVTKIVRLGERGTVPRIIDILS